MDCTWCHWPPSLMNMHTWKAIIGSELCKAHIWVHFSVLCHQVWRSMTLFAIYHYMVQLRFDFYFKPCSLYSRWADMTPSVMVALRRTVFSSEVISLSRDGMAPMSIKRALFSSPVTMVIKSCKFRIALGIFWMARQLSLYKRHLFYGTTFLLENFMGHCQGSYTP